MNRRDALKRLMALGLVATEPEIVRRFWALGRWGGPEPEYLGLQHYIREFEAKIEKQAKILDSVIITFDARPEPQEWDYYLSSNGQTYIYHQAFGQLGKE